jgi:hypothetical protein
MEKSYHYLGIEWRERKPFLIYRKDPEVLEKTFDELRTGNKFTIKITGKKECTGYHDEKTHKEELCPGHKHVWKKDLYQCFECRNHETLNFFSLAGLNAEQTEILRGKQYYNYLNLFGNDIVKVGVTTEGNKWKRVLEQAADSTLFFTQTDGITAREIENFVSKNFQIKQAVTSIQKVKLLKELIPEKESKAKLLATYFQIKLALSEEYKEFLIDIPEFSYNDKYFGFKELEKIDEIRFVDEAQVGDVFSGEIIGIPGQILLYQQDDKYFALNTSKIKGFLFEFKDKPEMNKINVFSKRIELPAPKPKVESNALF